MERSYGGGYYEKLTAGTDRPSTDTLFINQETAEEKDYLGADMQESMVPFALKRAYDRRSSQYEDTDWKIDEDLDKEIKANYSEQEEKYLVKAGSQEEFLAKRVEIQEDRERMSAMASGGWKGIAANLAFSIIDPVNLAVSYGTGGLSAVPKIAQMSRLARMGVIGATSGIENVAIDAMLMQGNSQSKASDLIVSFGAGALIGGALTGLSRTEMPKLARDADLADAAVHADAEGHIMSEAVRTVEGSDLPIKRIQPDGDARAIQMELDGYENELRKTVNDNLHPTTVTKIKAKIKDLKRQLKAEEDVRTTKVSEAQEDLTSIREGITEAKVDNIEWSKKSEKKITDSYESRIKAQEDKVASIGKRASKKGLKSDAKLSAKLYKAETELDALKRAIDAEIKDARKIMGAKVDEAEARFTKAFDDRVEPLKRSTIADTIRDLKGRLDRNAKAKDATAQIKKWDSMTEAERIDHVFKGREIPNAKVELERQLNGHAEVLKETVDAIKPKSGSPEPSSIGEVGGVKEGTAGAMQFGDTFDRDLYDIAWDKRKKLAMLADIGSKVPENLVGSMLPGKRTRFTDALHAAQTIISNSKDYAIRGMGYLMFEAPQGGKAAAATVSIRVRNYSKQIRSAMRNRLNEGLEEWGKENGLSRYATLMKQENYRSYNKAVMLEVKRSGTYDSPAIQKGADGVREQLKTAGIIRRDAGEAGFENIDFDENYIPVIMDSQAIKNALTSNKGYSKFQVQEVISLGYQKGAFRLDPDLADSVAEAYVKRALDHTMTIREAIRTTSGKDIDDIAKRLKKAGVDDETIREFIEDSLEKETKQHMSNRAKKSLRPDISVEFQGLKLIDLIDNDLPKLLESYTRDAAGGAAFAKIGLRTRQEVLDTLDTIEKGAIKNGMSPTDAARDIQILKDGVDLSYGRSLNVNDNPRFIRNLSRLRDLTGLLRLQFVGAASIPELARITAQRSLSSVLEACPELGSILGTKNLRKGGKYSGKFKRQDLDELERVMGYEGEDFVLYPNGLRADDLEETDLSGRLGTFFDNALAQGRRVQEIASGFRMIQGTGEKLAVRSLASDIKKWATEGGKSLSNANIERAGWSDGFLDDLKKFMQDNPATDIYNGKEFKLFNFGKMSPDMQERLQLGMHRLVMADMQRMNIGETPIFMHKWLGQTLTQFRSFSIISLEKQLVHDYKHDKAMGAIMAIHSALLSYAGLGISVMQQNLGKEDFAERVKERMTGKNAVIGSINRMGQLASMGIGIDLMATLGVLPDYMLANRDEYGARALTTGSVPVMGLVTDLAQAPKAVADLIKGKEDANNTLKEIQDIIPFAKAIGINQGLNILKEQLK